MRRARIGSSQSAQVPRESGSRQPNAFVDRAKPIALVAAILLVGGIVPGFAAVSNCPAQIESSLAEADIDPSWGVEGAATAWQAVEPGSGDDTFAFASADIADAGLMRTPELTLALSEPPFATWGCVRTVLEARVRVTRPDGGQLVRFTLYADGQEVAQSGTDIGSSAQARTLIIEVAHLCGTAPANLSLGITGLSLPSLASRGEIQFEVSSIRLFALGYGEGTN